MTDPFTPSDASRRYHEACEAEAARRARVRHLMCAVCGGDAGVWRQHWNRDTGWGVCATCVSWLRGRQTSEAEILSLYGVEGVNFAPGAPAPILPSLVQAPESRLNPEARR